MNFSIVPFQRRDAHRSVKLGNLFVKNAKLFRASGNQGKLVPLYGNFMDCIFDRVVVSAADKTRGYRLKTAYISARYKSYSRPEDLKTIAYEISDQELNIRHIYSHIGKKFYRSCKT